MIEVRAVETLGGHWLGGSEGTFCGDCGDGNALVCGVGYGNESACKIHSAVYLRFLHFIVCKLSVTSQFLKVINRKRKKIEAQVKKQGSSPGCQTFASPCPSQCPLFYHQTTGPAGLQESNWHRQSEILGIHIPICHWVCWEIWQMLASMPCKGKGAGWLLWAQPCF